MVMVKLYVSLLLLADNVKFRLRREESGATAVEYGLLVGLIAVVIIAAVYALGGKLTGIFENTTTHLSVVPS